MTKGVHFIFGIWDYTFQLRLKVTVTHTITHDSQYKIQFQTTLSNYGCMSSVELFEFCNSNIAILNFSLSNKTKSNSLLTRQEGILFLQNSSYFNGLYFRFFFRGCLGKKRLRLAIRSNFVLLLTSVYLLKNQFSPLANTFQLQIINC